MWGTKNMMDAVFSKGGTVLSEDGKTVTIDSPEWIDTWDLFRKWIHEDKTMRIHSGGQGWEYWYKTIDDVMKGQAAGYTGSSGDQGDLDFTQLGGNGTARLGRRWSRQASSKCDYGRYSCKSKSRAAASRIQMVQLSS